MLYDWIITYEKNNFSNDESTNEIVNMGSNKPMYIEIFKDTIVDAKLTIDFRKGLNSLSKLISTIYPKTNLKDLLFIILVDFINPFVENGDMYGMIVNIIKTMPGAPIIMVLVLLTKDDEQPNKAIQLMWCILLILLPIRLLFAESSVNYLQSVSIVATFPIGIVIVMIAISFLKNAKEYIKK